MPDPTPTTPGLYPTVQEDWGLLGEVSLETFFPGLIVYARAYEYVFVLREIGRKPVSQLRICSEAQRKLGVPAHLPWLQSSTCALSAMGVLHFGWIEVLVPRPCIGL